MKQSFWFCQRCYLLHPDGEECPKPGVEGDTRALPPALLGRTRENEIRPDENNFAKELRIAAQQMEEAGRLSGAEAEYFKAEIAKYKHQSSRFWKDKAIPYITPADLRKKRTVVRGGF